MFRLPALPVALICALGGHLSAADPPSKANIIVILTDDQGWADLGAQGQVRDIKTPHLDQLAAGGVRCTAAYITAPQCSPSRAGLLTGRYQQRFDFDSIPDGPLPLEESTLAERLRAAGYVCGMVGKWHLDPNATCAKWIARNLPDQADKPRRQPPAHSGLRPGGVRIPESARLAYSPAARGFDEFFQGERHRYWASYDLNGNDLAREGQWVATNRYRIDIQTDAALAFLKRNQSRPFFLYLAYFGPHTPLEATREYLDRFPGPMPERRRHALAMLAAIDDGLGRIMARLREYGLEQNTLLFFTSDNGAPLKMTRPDSPLNTDAGGWDGSLNDPWVGEKGMLTEGGLRVPFVVHWKGVLPAGNVYSPPVSALDIAATAIAAAQLPRDQKLDGVDLVPFLTGRNEGAPHPTLFWRFWNQAAVRSGRWKYLQAGHAASGQERPTARRGEFLFDLSTDAHETRNLLQQHPAIAKDLAAQLAAWSKQLKPPGLPDRPPNAQEWLWYKHYLNLRPSGP